MRLPEEEDELAAFQK
jgi:hypothetical protein